MVQKAPSPKASFDSLWLDLGNVLIHFNPLLLWKQVGTVLGLSPDEVRNRLQTDHLQWKYEKGLLDTDQFLSMLAKGVAPRENLRKEIGHAFCDIFSLNEPMLFWALEQKRTFGTRLVLVSNTNPLHIDFVSKKYGILQHFDTLVLSFEVKSMKPELDFFHKTADLAGTPTQASLYIDDLGDNIQSGKIFGINSFQFTDFETFKLELFAKNLEPQS